MFIIKTRFLHFATLNCKHGAVISKICKWLNSVNTKETSLEYFSNHRKSKYQFGFNGSYISSTTTGQARNTIQPSLIILYARFILNDLSLDMYFELTPCLVQLCILPCSTIQFSAISHNSIHEHSLTLSTNRTLRVGIQGNNGTLTSPKFKESAFPVISTLLIVFKSTVHSFYV